MSNYSAASSIRLESTSFIVYVDYSNALLAVSHYGDSANGKPAMLTVENKNTGNVKVTEHLLFVEDMDTIAETRHSGLTSGLLIKKISDLFNDRTLIAVY